MDRYVNLKDKIDEYSKCSIKVPNDMMVDGPNTKTTLLFIFKTFMLYKGTSSLLMQEKNVIYVPLL